MRGKGPGSKRSGAQIVPVVRKQAIGEKEARRNGKGMAQQQHPAPAPVSSGMARGSQQQISPTKSSTLLSRGLVLADLRQRLFGILIELPHGFPAVLVVHHLGQKLRWNGDDMRASQRGALDIDHCADAPHQDLGRVAPFLQPMPHAANDAGRVVPFVAHASRENAQVGRAGLGRQDGLIKGENRSGIDRNSFPAEGMNHAQAGVAVFVDHRNLHHDIGCPAGKRAALLEHSLSVVRGYLDAYGAIPQQRAQPPRRSRLFRTTPIRLAPTPRAYAPARCASSRGVSPPLTTRTMPSTSVAKIRLSATLSSGGESTTTKWYSTLASRSRVRMRSEESSSAGFGGTGPQTSASRLSSPVGRTDRKSTRLNSSHVAISYAVFCLKKKHNNELNH